MIRPDLKEKLARGEVVVGTFFKTNSPNLAEMFGYAGYDFIIIDNEHSNFSFTEIENIIRAADGVGMHSIVRVPSPLDEHLAHSLDSGASGVQIPSLRDVEQARKAVPYTKYYPLGIRGMNANQRACKFGFMNSTEYFKAANEQTLVVVHVENKEMVDQVEELCQVPGIDVLFAVPGDLSQSIGKPMQVNDPEVVAMIEKIFNAAAKYNKIAGIWVGNAADAEKYIKMGARYIGYGSDTALITAALKEKAKDIQELKKKA